ncbi:hypothetical protein GCM10027519_09920 [Kineococcus endophyticus]
MRAVPQEKPLAREPGVDLPVHVHSIDDRNRQRLSSKACRTGEAVTARRSTGRVEVPYRSTATTSEAPFRAGGTLRSAFPRRGTGAERGTGNGERGTSRVTCQRYHTAS